MPIIRGQLDSRGYTDEYEKGYVRKDGSVFLATVRIWLTGDKVGEPSGMWAIIQDITKRKQAEEALRQHKEKLQRMFETVGDAITVSDLNGVITEVNESAVRLSGYGSKDDLIGKYSFDHIAPRHRLRAQENMGRLL